jgi:hypothetical protein
VGMLTKTRGSEMGNLVAMVCGFIAVAVLSGLHNDLWNLLHPSDPDFLAWMTGHPKGPAFQIALGLAAHHRFPVANHRRDLGDSRRGFDLPHTPKHT